MRALAPLLMAAALSGCGNAAPPGPPVADPFEEVRRDAAKPTVRRASPRWERVALLAGRGPASRSVAIARGAIQWRARWRCTRGVFALTDSERTSVARGRCPGRGVSTAAATIGPQRIAVGAEGPWRIEIEQQVDTALREPPLRAMRSAGARVLSVGRFGGVERRGSGTVALHRLSGGRLALRFERFDTSPNSDLFVWVSRGARPRTTRAAFRAPHVSVAALKSTLGDQNYLLPRSVRERDVRSIVIWCEPVRIAYAAATLRRP